ncbi:MAG: urease accessory protein UreF [Gammaproteobacteria bacterium]|nr:urease accessory protein UreF [Gammaproteobacteria bacterium]
MSTRITTTTEDDLAWLRLLHLVSPTLPTGAFTYSQGVEWAVECGWVRDVATLGEWASDLMHSSLAQLELPLLARLYRACETGDGEALRYWNNTLIASRETRELREEERNRGRALAALLPALGINISDAWRPLLKGCQLSGFAYAACHWQIPLRAAAQGYLWAWLEGTVLTGIKIIPLGQSAGQSLIAGLTPAIPGVVARGMAVSDAEIGASCTAQAIASCLHETQYTRIYQS